jgi:hypothetical protein
VAVRSAHTPIYVSSYTDMCSHTTFISCYCISAHAWLSGLLIHRYMCPHTPINVSSYYYSSHAPIYRRMRGYQVCSYTDICVLMLLCISYHYISVHACVRSAHTQIYVSSYTDKCALILLCISCYHISAHAWLSGLLIHRYMCPHTPMHVSSCQSNQA